MKSLLLLSLALFALPTCKKQEPVQPPGDTRSAPRLNTALGNRDSVVASYVQVADENNDLQPEGKPKAAVRGALGVLRSYFPAPFEKDLATARKVASDAAWTLAQGEAIRLRQQLADLEAKVKLEREAAEREHQRQLDEARNKAKQEADAKLHLWLMLGLFGGGAGLVVLAILSIQFAATIPFLGPNITRALFTAGGALFGLGLLLRSIDRFVDQHPYLFYGGLIIVVLALIAAALLAYSNHHHTQESTPRAPAS